MLVGFWRSNLPVLVYSRFYWNKGKFPFTVRCPFQYHIPCMVKNLDNSPRKPGTCFHIHLLDHNWILLIIFHRVIPCNPAVLFYRELKDSRIHIIIFRPDSLFEGVNSRLWLLKPHIAVPIGYAGKINAAVRIVDGNGSSGNLISGGCIYFGDVTVLVMKIFIVRGIRCMPNLIVVNRKLLLVCPVLHHNRTRLHLLKPCRGFHLPDYITARCQPFKSFRTIA